MKSEGSPCFSSSFPRPAPRVTGSHTRQDSMEPSDLWDDVSNCRCGDRLKTLEQRARRQHQRCLAHSLVGTPNYIAPEVLLRKGACVPPGSSAQPESPSGFLRGRECVLSMWPWCVALRVGLPFAPKPRGAAPELVWTECVPGAPGSQAPAGRHCLPWSAWARVTSSDASPSAWKVAGCGDPVPRLAGRRRKLTVGHVLSAAAFVGLIPGDALREL